MGQVGPARHALVHLPAGWRWLVGVMTAALSLIHCYASHGLSNCGQTLNVAMWFSTRYNAYVTDKSSLNAVQHAQLGQLG